MPTHTINLPQFHQSCLQAFHCVVVAPQRCIIKSDQQAGVNLGSAIDAAVAAKQNYETHQIKGAFRSAEAKADMEAAGTRRGSRPL